ncbi:aminoglycoside phosphotransferase family protein [Kutzneria buriramensis]|uniref:Streptomycin 6-kinase n=1 Tax=Kutzneria buriramensis TaxID=1045776 RepID=A0A3E0H6R2_9PSEU|nr:aminoglycoside phosphotransferase family protein [Kutzneria buriramensis]REH38192.1 streptomycin 6-kinase [Kutzneria buriramensis]
MEEVATRLASRYGAEAETWVAEIPNLAARLAARWGLRLGALFESGASSVVLRCEWRDGTPAVLKLSLDLALVSDQVEMLRVFAPTGRVPAVLAADAEAGATVLEEVRPGTMAEDLPQETLPQQWGELLAALHAVAPPQGWPRTLRGRMDEAFARIGTRLSEPAIGARISEAAWQRAIQRCEKLLATQDKPVLLHGDLHLGNALDGGPERGLVAIDPKACIGDPCFDAVDYVLDGAGHDGVAARCERVAAACGLDGDRLHEWSRATAPMAAIGAITYNGPGLEELVALAD